MTKHHKTSNIYFPFSILNLYVRFFQNPKTVYFLIQIKNPIFSMWSHLDFTTLQQYETLNQEQHLILSSVWNKKSSFGKVCLLAGRQKKMTHSLHLSLSQELPVTHQTRLLILWPYRLQNYKKPSRGKNICVSSQHETRLDDDSCGQRDTQMFI